MAKKKQDKEDNKISVGMIVYYVFGKENNAAIVTRVTDKEVKIVNLFVFMDARGLTHATHYKNVKYSTKEGANDTWHFVEDVIEKEQEKEQVEEVQETELEGASNE